MSAAPRRLPVARLLFAVIAGFVLAASVGSGALFAYQGRYSDRIYPGVRVAGLDVAGLDREAASALLGTTLASYGAGSVVITAGTHTVELSDADLGRRVDIEGLLDEAFAVGRFADPVGNAADGVRTLVNGTDIAPRVTVDVAATALAVQAAASRIDQPPVNATARWTAAGFSTTPAATTAAAATRSRTRSPDTRSTVPGAGMRSGPDIVPIYRWRHTVSSWSR